MLTRKDVRRIVDALAVGCGMGQHSEIANVFPRNYARSIHDMQKALYGAMIMLCNCEANLPISAFDDYTESLQEEAIRLIQNGLAI